MAKPFKLELPPGCVLSQTFANTRNCYKVVEPNNILGYTVAGVDPFRITPLYRATIYYTVKTRSQAVLHATSAYEHGTPLNAWSMAEDDEGATLARIAAHAILRLERRARENASPSRAEAASRRTTPRRKR